MSLRRGAGCQSQGARKARQTLRTSAARRCLWLLTGGVLSACAGRAGDLDTVQASATEILLSVDNRHTSDARIYLRLGSLRIHLLTVAGNSRGETQIPEEFSGSKARVTVWIPSESYIATTADFTLEQGTRLELSITSAAPSLIARRNS